MNTLNENNLNWLSSMYVSVDQKDLSGYGNFIAENCNLEFGNNPLVQGKENFLAAIGGFFSTIKGLKHTNRNVWQTDTNCFVLEANVTYTRMDDTLVTIPAVSIVEKNDANLMVYLRVFIDLTPLYSV